MKTVKTIVALSLITGLFVFFQNCSVQQGGGLLGSQTSASQAEETLNANTPFAYDLAPDTISYNSCVGENLNTNGIHGLKIGVNEGFTTSTGAGTVKGGLKLRSDFLQYVGTNIAPAYPSTVITPGQIQNLLTNSTINKNSYIQFSVRRRSDLTVMPDLIQPSSLSITPPRDGTALGAVLNMDPVLTNLTKNVQFGENGVILSEGPRVYNLSDNTSTPQPIQASFGFSNIDDETFAKQGLSGDNENFGIGERYSEIVRNKFNLATDDKYLLTTTFGDATSGSDYGLNAPKRKDSSVKARAYGRAYALGFSTFVTPSANGWKNNALKTVTEYDLATNAQVGATWSCSSYVIMKKNQWNSGKLDQPSCTPLIASDLDNATIANAVKKLRRHYSADSWNIGLFYDKNQAYVPGARTSQPICLTPTQTNSECYLETYNTVVLGTDVGVNYNPLTECYLYNQIGVSYSGTLANIKAAGRCAQFASICVRSGDN